MYLADVKVGTNWLREIRGGTADRLSDLPRWLLEVGVDPMKFLGVAQGGVLPGGVGGGFMGDSLVPPPSRALPAPSAR